MEQKVNIAVLGCGLISDFHIKAILADPQARLAGVCDHQPMYARGKAENYGTHPYESYEELLSDRRVDAVCICTPSGYHARHAYMAMEAGKHVLVEKPAALTLSDCSLLSHTAAQKGTLISVVSQLRYSPAVRRIQSLLKQGRLGTLVSAHLSMNYYRDSQYYAGSQWRGTYRMDGGGALMNQGIHGIDLLLAFMGPVHSVFSHAGTFIHPIEAEDSLCALVTFCNKAMGTVQAATSAYPGTPRLLTIYGSKGTVALEEDRITRLDIEGMLPGEYDSLVDARLSAAADPGCLEEEGHRRQLHNFVRAILGEEPLLVTLQQGKDAIETVLGCYQSASEGREVILSQSTADIPAPGEKELSL